MSSIKFPNQPGTLPINIAEVKHFLELNRYTGGPTNTFYYLILIKSEILAYMTRNLFSVIPKEGLSSADFLSSDTIPIPSAPLSRNQPVYSMVPREVFDDLLEKMKEEGRKIETERSNFRQARKSGMELIRSEAVIDFLASDEVTRMKESSMKIDIVEMIKKVLTSPVPRSASEYDRSMDQFRFFFAPFRRYLMNRVDTLINDSLELWSEGGERDERNYDYYRNYRSKDALIDVLRDVYEISTGDTNADESWAAYKIGKFGRVEDRTAEGIKGAIESDLELIGYFIRKVYEESDEGDEENEESDEEESESNEEEDRGKKRKTGLPDDQGIVELYRFFASISDAYSYLLTEGSKLRAIEDYRARGQPKGIPNFESIYKSEEMQSKVGPALIPFVGYTTTYGDPIPDYDQVVYKPKTLREVPSADDIVLLNEIKSMIVRKVGSEQLIFVGRLREPGYIINARFMGPREGGPRIEAVKYMNSDLSVPNKFGNIEGYLEYSTCFRSRRRGKLYCVFYHEKRPYAADEKHIYTLNPKQKAESNGSIPKRLAQLYSYAIDPSRNTAEIKRRYEELLRDISEGTSVAIIDFYKKLDPSKCSNFSIELAKIATPISTRLQWISQAGTIQEAMNRVDEIYRLVDNMWKSENIGVYHGLERLRNSGSKNLSQFLLSVTDLINSIPSMSKEDELLDFYTQEALLYAFNCSKVNLTTGQREEQVAHIDQSTHTNETYVVVSVRRPDDLFYNKLGNLAYDVSIIESNIYPRLTLDEMTQNTYMSIDQKKVEDQIIKVRYWDPIWMRQFSRSEAIEVFDTTTMSVITFCVPEQFATEVVIGPSLRIGDVINRLNLLHEQSLTYRQYTLESYPRMQHLVNYIAERASNPLFAHYLLNMPKSTVTDEDRRIVYQAFRGIAYTLYCKLKSKFGVYQDLTTVINSISPEFHRCKFRRRVIQSVNEHQVGNVVKINVEGNSDQRSKETFSIICVVESIQGDQVHFKPRSQQGSVFRILSLGESKEVRKEYNDYLESFYEQRGNETIGFEKLTASDPLIREKTEYVLVPDQLKAQIIGHIINPNYKELSRKDVDSFISNVRKGTMANETVRLHASTTYGITTTLDDGNKDGGRLIINDRIQGTVTTLNIPFIRPAVTKSVETEVEEPTLDEPFVGTIDMTFLTLLDHALYQGEETFINRLFGIFHEYERGYFSSDDLGTFLFSELVEKVWPDSVIQRVYFLLSHQKRNLVLRSSQRVILREGSLQKWKPIMITMKRIPWVGRE